MDENLPDREWSTLFDELFDAVVVLRAVRDDYGRIVDFVLEYANEAWTDVAGRERDAVIGHRLLEMYPGLGQSPLFDAYSRAISLCTKQAVTLDVAAVNLSLACACQPTG